jgi:hypothetical protein
MNALIINTFGPFDPWAPVYYFILPVLVLFSVLLLFSHLTKR